MIPKDLRIPGYDIEALLGKGGMAAVYRARQQNFGRDVALKVLNPAVDDLEEFSRRFLQESVIAAKLHHSNIVQVYNVGQHENFFYISMEYLDGGDLSNRLQQGLSIRETLRIITQLADALDFAHRKNIIHRDIKPANIMFREDGAAVLTDFGIAKELESQSDLTQTGLILGTPKYMSPEHLRGEEVDHRADIYALGIVFYRCLTNYVPFDGKDMVTTAYLQDCEPVPALPPEVACFQPVINRMLEKSPLDRFQRAREVIEALEQIDKSQYSPDLTNLDVAAAHKAAPPTVTRSTSGRHSVTGSHSASGRIEPRIGSDQTVFHFKPGLNETIRAEHMTDSGYGASTKLAVKRKSGVKAVVLGAVVFGGLVIPANQLLQSETNFGGVAATIWEQLVNGTLGKQLAPLSEEISSARTTNISGPVDVHLVRAAAEKLGLDSHPVVSKILPLNKVEIEYAPGEPASSEDMLARAKQKEQLAAEAAARAAAVAEQVSILLAEAESLRTSYRLRRPAGQNAYSKYQEVLGLQPDNAEALAGVEKIADAYIAMMERALNEKKLDAARSYLDEAREISPHRTVYENLESKLAFAIEAKREQELLLAAEQRLTRIQELLLAAKQDEEAGRIRSPVGNNALEKYQQILDLDPNNIQAINKLIEYGR